MFNLYFCSEIKRNRMSEIFAVQCNPPLLLVSILLLDDACVSLKARARLVHLWAPLANPEPSGLIAHDTPQSCAKEKDSFASH